MNYNFLLPEKPLPSYYKLVSLILITIIGSLGLYLKFTNSTDIQEITPGFLKWFLFLALTMFLISRDKIEDERTIEIQLQIFRLGFRFLLGAIMIFEGGSLLSGNYSNYPVFYFFVISILGYLVIFSELSKKSNVIDLIQKNRFLYHVASLSTMLLIMFFNKWLWGWPTV